MILRKARIEDVEAAHEIYEGAKKFMRESGNGSQWSGDYPSGEDVLAGIEAGTSYVVEDCGEIVATLHFEVGREPSYDKIYDGSWKNDAPYAFIHRIAVKYHGRKIAKFCFDECFKMHANLKIDTHENNLPMQSALLHAGFVRCGKIVIEYLREDKERVAFQRSE